MMFVMVSDLVELLFQRPNSCFAVNELQMSASIVMLTGKVDDSCTSRLVDLPGQIERHAGIIQSFGPGVLIESTQNLARFTKRPANSIRQHTFRIRQMM